MLKIEGRIRRIMLFSLMGGLAYVIVSRYGPLGMLMEGFGDRGWIPMVLGPAFSGLLIGLTIAYSAVLCFHPDEGLKKRLLLAGTVGGVLYWILNPLGLLHFVGILVFASFLAWSGTTGEMKVRILAGVISGDLFNMELISLPSVLIFSLQGREEAERFLTSSLSDRSNLLAVMLGGYMTNLGLLLGLGARVPLIWYGAALGFLITALVTPFPGAAYLQVLMGTAIGAGIGYALDHSFTNKAEGIRS